jgi:hypothetical protein
MRNVPPIFGAAVAVGEVVAVSSPQAASSLPTAVADSPITDARTRS